EHSIKNFHLIVAMEFVDWFPHYQSIRQRFGYSTQKDQEAANILSKMIKRKALDKKVLQRKIAGKQVIVIGSGPGLEKNLGLIKRNAKFIKIVANGAAQVLIERKIKPNIVVTDLDGNPSFLQKADKLGATMVVHAHGDNIAMLKKLVPKFSHIIGSTQVMPVENVYNFGGFTDGDRCVFLAEEFSAKEIILIGMEFGPHLNRYSRELIRNGNLKDEKMKVARKLLEMLAKQGSQSNLFDTSTRPIKGFKHFIINEDN
ncbi:MAG: 6-hydroxymethylpterin diphosphokinase MptE-like protein, partial [Nitrososphaeraceae archaeon]